MTTARQPQHEPDESYEGTATIQGLGVQVALRSHFEPIDGTVHWYGRIAANEALARDHQSGSRVPLVTPYGEAVGRLSDLDPWGRFRISGTGRPPF